MAAAPVEVLWQRAAALAETLRDRTAIMRGLCRLIRSWAAAAPDPADSDGGHRDLAAVSAHRMSRKRDWPGASTG